MRHRLESSSRHAIQPPRALSTAMRSLLLVLLLGSTLRAVTPIQPPPAYQPDLTEYGWIELGGAVISDLDGRLKDSSLDETFNTDIRLSLSPGFAVSGGFGERFTPSFIAEIQGGLFYHNIDHIRTEPTGRWSVDASLFQVPVMLNLVFEIPLRHSLRPFLGAGVGAVISWLDIDDNFPATSDGPGARLDRTSTEIKLAYQGFAGLRFQLAQQGVLTVTYRAVAGGSPDWTLKERETGRNVGSLQVNDVLVHSFTLGFMVPF